MIESGTTKKGNQIMPEIIYIQLKEVYDAVCESVYGIVNDDPSVSYSAAISNISAIFNPKSFRKEIHNGSTMLYFPNLMGKIEELKDNLIIVVMNNDKPYIALNGAELNY